MVFIYVLTKLVTASILAFSTFSPPLFLVDLILETVFFLSEFFLDSLLVSFTFLEALLVSFTFLDSLLVSDIFLDALLVSFTFLDSLLVSVVF